MAKYLGLIGGSSFLKSEYFTSNSFVPETRTTRYGQVKLWFNHADGVVFVQRHAADPAVAYSPPHLINKKAIITALHQLGVARVIAFNSTGSMTKQIALGSLVIPDDFLCLDPITFFDDARAHLIPGYDDALRTEVVAQLRRIAAAAECDFHAAGAYLQTHGPRFETKAEIRHFARDCAVVGMTAGHEAVLCKELGLPYAAVCMIDNWANGLDTVGLTTDEFHAGVAKNLRTMELVLAGVVSSFKPLAETLAAAAAGADAGKTHVDSLIFARWVVPVAAAAPGTVLEDQAVAVRDGKIVAVLPAAVAREQYTAAVTDDLGADHVLIPGLVNAHTHVGMSLLRGYSDDKPVGDWLIQDIWPAEGKFMSPEFVTASARLAFAEMLQSGTTCVNDMYFEPAATAATAAAFGMRAVIGFPVLDFPDKSACEGQLNTGLAAAAAHKGNPLLQFAVCPHAPYTVCDENLVRCKEAAETAGVRLHVHLHETEAEVTDSIAGNTSSMACHRSDQRTAPLDNLDRLGLLTDKTVAVHMTQLTQEQIATVAARGTHVVHCPYSNLKLASGFTQVQALAAAGVNVALGTDSCASNNSLDMVAEMKLASVLAKAVAKDATAVSAVTALQMATLNGARALGLDSRVGSLEAGKEADIVAVKFGSLSQVPMYDVVSHLVYSTGRDSVTDVWVAGARKVAARQLLCADVAAIVADARAWQEKISDFRSEHDLEFAAKRPKKV